MVYVLTLKWLDGNSFIAKVTAYILITWLPGHGRLVFEGQGTQHLGYRASLEVHISLRLRV